MSGEKLDPRYATWGWLTACFVLLYLLILLADDGDLALRRRVDCIEKRIDRPANVYIGDCRR